MARRAGARIKYPNQSAMLRLCNLTLVISLSAQTLALPIACMNFGAATSLRIVRLLSFPFSSAQSMVCISDRRRSCKRVGAMRDARMYLDTSILVRIFRLLQNRASAESV